MVPPVQQSLQVLQPLVQHPVAIMATAKVVVTLVNWQSVTSTVPVGLGERLYLGITIMSSLTLGSQCVQTYKSGGNGNWKFATGKVGNPSTGIKGDSNSNGSELDSFLCLQYG